MYLKVKNEQQKKQYVLPPTTSKDIEERVEDIIKKPAGKPGQWKANIASIITMRFNSIKITSKVSWPDRAHINSGKNSSEIVKVTHLKNMSIS